MDKIEFSKMAYRIRIICKNWGIPRLDVEECIQWVALKRAEGKNKHQYLSHSVIDWMREYYVSKRRKDYAEAKLLLRPREYNSGTDGREYKEYITEDIFRLLNLIEEVRTRDIVFQRIVWGESNLDLSIKWGVSGGRVSQLYAKGVAEIKAKIEDQLQSGSSQKDA